MTQHRKAKSFGLLATAVIIALATLQTSVHALPWVDPAYTHASDSAIEAFKDLKFGLRIHWGPYCIDSTVNNRHNGESWCLKQRASSVARYNEYLNFYKTWNPAEYDAGEWAHLMADNGMTFFSFTTKHHDGFCMYDTKTTVPQYVTRGSGGVVIKENPEGFHYSIMETPYGKDVLAELIDSCMDRPLPSFVKGIDGFKIGLYFSHIDWYDADFRFGASHPLYKAKIDKSYTQKRYPAGYARAKKRYLDQIREVCGMVPKGKLLCIGWDMGFPSKEKFGVDNAACDTMAYEGVMLARSLQPDALFRNRGLDTGYGGGPNQKLYYGDYYTTEESIPPGQATGNWMVIYPLGDPFDFDPDPAGTVNPAKSRYKGAAWIVRNLVDIIAKGGVFQIGIGPGPDGRFHPNAISQIEEAGAWLRKNGEGVYCTRPYKVWHQKWNGKDSIRFTCTKDTAFVYAHCMAWPGNTLTLDSVTPMENSDVIMLGDSSRTPLAWESTGSTTTITVPAELKATDSLTWVFRIQTRAVAVKPAVPAVRGVMNRQGSIFKVTGTGWTVPSSFSGRRVVVTSFDLSGRQLSRERFLASGQRIRFDAHHSVRIVRIDFLTSPR